MSYPVNAQPLVLNMSAERISPLQWRKCIHSATHHQDPNYFFNEGQRVIANSFELLSTDQSKWNFTKGLHWSFEKSLIAFQSGLSPGPHAISIGHHASLILQLNVASEGLLNLCKKTQSVMYLRLPRPLQAKVETSEILVGVEEPYYHLMACMILCRFAEGNIEHRLGQEASQIIHVEGIAM